MSCSDKNVDGASVGAENFQPDIIADMETAVTSTFESDDHNRECLFTYDSPGDTNNDSDISDHDIIQRE